MCADLLHGRLVRLTSEDPKGMAARFSGWRRNSVYLRNAMMDVANLYSIQATEKWLEKTLLEPQPDNFFFFIRTLQDDRVIGDIGLDGVSWSRGDSYVGIGIGEQSEWGKGYGTDAMHILQRYAFTELNLRRLTLNFFEYNERGLRSYLKAGFRVEGRQRQVLRRDGNRWDLIYMGILREEWEALQLTQPTH